MKNNPINFMELGAIELTLNELIQIEGGGFWRTVGQIVGVAAVVAIIWYAPAIIALL
ncbi:hypothetical protein [Sandaracinomonas limnophila]|uniref:hypothetical protein n=1 Tax=Sandaracinomonas limnophila TaxID=1862386 RepID=UPI0013E2FEE4|nr:hypothetical protein [Sandaracinomonas limnophila]